MGCSVCSGGFIALSGVHCDSKIRGVERGFKTRPEEVLSDCIESRSVSGGCCMTSRYPHSAIAASGLDRLRYLVEASVSAHYSFIQDWQEEEAVLSRGSD